MEKITGIGGIFLRARDPKALALGISNIWALLSTPAKLMAVWSLRPMI